MGVPGPCGREGLNPGPRLRRQAAPSAPDTHLYVWGSQGFIDHVLGTSKARGWPAAQLHVEYFGGAVPDTGRITE
jgi:ferredoxin-NADP reductase